MGSGQAPAAGYGGAVEYDAGEDAVNEETAVRVWRGLRSLVLDRADRRREVSEALGISFAMAKALRLVAEEGELSMSLLATRLITDLPYTSLVVEGLVKRGYVTRTPDPADRRRKLVRPTPEGREAAATARAILDNPPDVLRALSADDLAALERVLAHLDDPTA
ncbi:MarR family winged helix-turn-helix transcriptional regulator [Actinocorallia aurea]